MISKRKVFQAISVFLLILGGTTPFLFATMTPPEGKIRARPLTLSVLPFVSRGEETLPWLAKNIPALLRFELQECPQLILHDVNEVDAALRLCGIELTQQVSRLKLEKFYELTNSDYLVFGAVSTNKNLTTLKIKVFSLNDPKKTKEVEIQGEYDSFPTFLAEAKKKILEVCAIPVKKDDPAAGSQFPLSAYKAWADLASQFEAEDWGGAIRACRNILEEHPHFQPAVQSLITACIRQKNSEEVEKIIQQAPVENLPLDTQIILALFYLDAHKSDAAKEIVKTILVNRTEEPHALFVLAKIYQEKRLWDLAVETLSKGVRYSASKEEYWLLQGDILREQRQISSALHAYQNALQINPRNREAIKKLSFTKALQGDYDQAYTLLSQAIAEPTQERISEGKMTPVLKTPESSSSIQEYLFAIEKNPNNAVVYNALAAAYEQEGEWGNAIQAYQKALHINPQFQAVYFNLAGALAGQGKIEEAKKNYLKSIELNPKHVESYRNLGRLYWKAGQPQLALQIWEKALGLDPKDQELAKKVAQIYVHEKDWKKAIKILEKYQTATHQNGAAKLLLGQCYLKENQAKQALRCFKESFKEGPNSPSIHKELANYYEEIAKDRKKALEFWETYLTKVEALEEKKETQSRISKLKEQLAQKQ